MDAASILIGAVFSGDFAHHKSEWNGLDIRFQDHRIRRHLFYLKIDLTLVGPHLLNHGIGDGE